MSSGVVLTRPIVLRLGLEPIAKCGAGDLMEQSPLINLVGPVPDSDGLICSQSGRGVRCFRWMLAGAAARIELSAPFR